MVLWVVGLERRQEQLVPFGVEECDGGLGRGEDMLADCRYAIPAEHERSRCSFRAACPHCPSALAVSPFLLLFCPFSFTA